MKMAYQAEVSRTNPSCILLLTDQSESMLEPWGNDPQLSKAEGLAQVINGFLYNLILKCTKSEGVRDYFHVGIIGYGSEVTSGFSGLLEGQTLVPVSWLEKYPLRMEARRELVDDGAGGKKLLTTQWPIWYQPRVKGRTFMCQALQAAEKLLLDWRDEHPACLPPLVINITDGEANDGNPLAAARQLMQLRFDDGPVLLFNLHISHQAAPSIRFPETPADLPDEYARVLWRMSSVLPERMRLMAQELRRQIGPQARGFIFNATADDLIKFLEIVTRAADQLLPVANV